jgi:hypothetical protein
MPRTGVRFLCEKRRWNRTRISESIGSMRNPAIEHPDHYVTAEEASIIARRSPSWVRTWACCGLIETVRSGRRTLFLRADVEMATRLYPPRKLRKRPHLRLVIDNT